MKTKVFFVTLTLFLFFTIVGSFSHLNAASTSVSWITPKAGSLVCSSHENCLNNSKLISFSVNDSDGLKNVELEGNFSNSWQTIDSISTSGNSYSYSNRHNIADVFGIDQANKAGKLRVKIVDASDNVEYSEISILVDRLAPQIQPIGMNSYVAYSNSQTQLLQRFSISDPSKDGLNGSGLSRFKFRVATAQGNGGNVAPSATGIEGYAVNLPSAVSKTEDVLVVFTWQRPLTEGYYWITYELNDNSVVSDTSTGAATLFNTGYGKCSSVNGGQPCAHLSGTTLTDQYFPFVVDTTPPKLLGFTANGLEVLPTTDDITGPITFNVQYSDNYSWVKEVYLLVNGQRYNFNVPNNSKSGNINLELGENIFNDGTNQISLCLSDVVGNNRCADTSTNTNNPNPIIVTVDWTASIQGKYVQFQGNVYPNDAAISSYLWSFGDGKTSTIKNPSHTYQSAGTYTIKFTANPTDLPSGSQPPSSTGIIVVIESTNNTGGNNQSGSNNTGGSSGTNNNSGSSNNSGTGYVYPGNTNPGSVLGSQSQNNGQPTTTNSDTQFRFADEDPIYATVGDSILIDLLVDSDLGIKNILWQTGDKHEKTTSVPILNYSYDEAGAYTLYVTAIDKRGVSHQISKMVYINEKSDGEVQGAVPTVTEDNIRRATISLSDIADFASKYPVFCSLMLILLIALILPFLRKYLGKDQYSEKYYEDFTNSTDPNRPLISGRMGNGDNTPNGY